MSPSPSVLCFAGKRIAVGVRCRQLEFGVFLLNFLDSVELPVPDHSQQRYYLWPFFILFALIVIGAYSNYWRYGVSNREPCPYMASESSVSFHFAKSGAFHSPSRSILFPLWLFRLYSKSDWAGSGVNKVIETMAGIAVLEFIDVIPSSLSSTIPYFVSIHPDIFKTFNLEPLLGFEPRTFRLQGECSTTELKRHKSNYT